MKLIIFTQTYPSTSSSEQTFIGRELPHLTKYFDKIIFIPQKIIKDELPLPKNTVINKDFAGFYKKQGFFGIIINALSSRYFYKELYQRSSTFVHPQMFLRLIKFVGDAEITKQWVKTQLKNIDMHSTLFYSFWFTQITTGLTFLKNEFPEIKIVSRAHGYDIYEEHYHPWPCRLQSIKSLNKLFLASKNAHFYMQQKYPQFSTLYQAAYLGVEDPIFLTKKSTDKVLRIISCSSIIPLKRIELLAQAIILVAQIRPTQKIHWIHFGDGKNQSKVQKIIASFPHSAKGELRGHVPNAQIMEYYKENPVDIFINTSETEGLPVSIMEAISCGIPVIATNVGGNPEIVSKENGILLNKAPTPKEIAQVILNINDNPEIANTMRIASRKKWKENFNAEANFEKFAQQLLEIAQN